MNGKNNQITALYCRLSIEDGGDNESMSIQNQKAMLKEYAERNGLLPFDFYVDDGYTGRNFNRPSFQRLIADIEAGKIHCVITKDLSRLGRNYIEAGSYIEVYFPRHHVRYIAVTDGVDTLTKSEMDITPFKNILNDMYSRDISKKVAAGCMARSRQGKYLGGPTPFGLMRDPAEKGHLIINPETAPTVRRIYDLALGGMGTFNIARVMMDENIPLSCKPTKSQYYTWSSATIGQILHNPFYRGAHVVCKTHQKGIRSGTYDKIPRSQWEVIEDCHEAIVTPEEWDTVQRLIASRPKVGDGAKKCPFNSVFSGLLHCADCGASLPPKYEKYGRTDIDRTTKKPREAMDKSYYACLTYIKLGKKHCTSHKIEARDLYELVLRDIRFHAARAFKDPEAFYERIANRLTHAQTADEAALKAEVAAITARNEEIDAMFMSLYSDKTRGVLSEQRFIMMTDRLEAEQAQNKEKAQSILTEMSHMNSRSRHIQQFVDEIRQYAEIDELTDELTHRLIGDIIIGETTEVNGERIQNIKIIYNFVGDISSELQAQSADVNYKKKTVQIMPD